MNTRALDGTICVVALLGTLAMGLAQSDVGRTTNAAGLPLPPLPPTPPRLPAALMKPPTNALIRSRPLQGPSTNPVPALRTSPLSPRTTTPSALAPFPLVFDAESKTLDAKPGQTNATFTFRLTNGSPEEVTIDQVRTSCGCTVAKLPAVPWKLPAGTNGQFDVVADLRGKHGVFSKMVYVYTSKGFKALNVRVNVPGTTDVPMGDRLRNLQIASTDRQAVFRGDCARCHSQPGVGKQGQDLYQGVCAVCHEAEHRATMVPDLRNLSHPTDAVHWRNWITHGKAGTLMPAWSQTEGGPLTEDQIDSLVGFLVGHFPTRPPAAPLAPAAAPAVPAVR
jgi:hypothetical protein